MRIQITNDELQVAVKTWFESKGLKTDPSFVFVVEAISGDVALVAPPLQPAPSPIIALQPGHAVTAEPPFSATVETTEFGYKDPQDNGIGFFTDPATGAEYRTNNATLIGASLPREVLLSTFLKIDDWRNTSIDLVWQKYAAHLRGYVLFDHPMLTIDSGGSHTLFKVPLVDAGPTRGSGNGLDLTHAATLLLKTGGKALCTYCIMIGDVMQEIRGWDFKTGKVG
jgi:hypothetical protein